jgi:MYXO-CTERM domain-containing protein
VTPIGSPETLGREAFVPRSTRFNLALSLMSIAIVINLVLLFSGDSSPGWPIAAVILLGAAGAALHSQRRDF